MVTNLEQQLEQLAKKGTSVFLRGALRGIEKEGLRVDLSGTLSQKDHPAGLGSALTNNTVTTDFSEALLEFVTPVFADTAETVQFLENLHRFSYSQLGDELIWAGSMPCHIADAASIPVARYGSSNIGQLKHIYRVGLEHRYGKMMQIIAGIHYNFSLPDEFWRALQQQQGNFEPLQVFRSSSYFKMIRNFRRNSWLLYYLFGASPALDASFLSGKTHSLSALHNSTLYLPYATSLRMSGLGYSTAAQSSLNICFNQLPTFIASLDKAIHTVYPPYEKIGVKVDGQYRQLSSSILQIENEYYSDIRPKRSAHSGEKPLAALRADGVEYVEVRLLDINPFLPAGIDTCQAQFIDAFLLSCLLMDDADLSPAECRMVSDNLHKVLTAGREPGLLLATPRGEITLTVAAGILLDKIKMSGELLDLVYLTNQYSDSVEVQKEKLADPAMTPSALILDKLEESGMEYAEWVVQKSREHRQSFQTLTSDTAILRNLTVTAAESHRQQQQLEAADSLDFDTFLAAYLAQ